MQALGFSAAQIATWHKKHVDDRRTETEKDGLTYEERRQLLGEQLFMMMEGKVDDAHRQVVTGMILDKGNDAVGYLLRRPAALKAEVIATIERVDACMAFAAAAAADDGPMSGQPSIYGVEV